MKFVRHIDPDGGYTLLRNVDYARSRKLVVACGALSQCMAVLFTGSILAGYLKYLGVPDTVAAVLMQIPLAGGAAQLFAPLFYANKRYRLRYVRFFYAVYRYMMAALGLIPLLFAPGDGRITAFAAMVLLGYLFGYMGDSAIVELISNLTSSRMRGRFIGMRDSVMVLCGAVCSLVVGSLLDVLRSNGDEAAGFASVFIMIFVLETIDVTLMGKIKEPPTRIQKETLRLRDVFTKPLGNPKFRKVIIHHVLWTAGVYVANSFFSIYMVGELGYQYSYIALLTMINTAGRVLSSRFWGRMSERMPWNMIIAINIGTLAVAHTLWFFSTSWVAYVLLPIAQFLGGVAWGGVVVGNMNIVISHSPSKMKNAYICMNTLISSVVGFVAAIIGSAAAGAMQEVRLALGPLTITNQQIMFLLSAGVLLISAAYTWRALKK